MLLHLNALYTMRGCGFIQWMGSGNRFLHVKFVDNVSYVLEGTALAMITAHPKWLLKVMHYFHVYCGGGCEHPLYVIGVGR